MASYKVFFFETGSGLWEWWSGIGWRNFIGGVGVMRMGETLPVAGIYWVEVVLKKEIDINPILSWTIVMLLYDFSCWLE